MAHDSELYAQLFGKSLRTQLPNRPANTLYAVATLIDKRQETEEVDEALRTMKEEFHTKMDAFQQRREELQRKQLEMKESFLRFDKFIKDTEAKRTRALTKQAEERETAHHLSEEVTKLRESLEELKLKQAKITKTTEKYEVFPKFIEHVVEYSSEFREAKDLMARFDALLSIKAGITEQESGGRAKMVKERQTGMDYSEEKTREILHQTQELAALRNKLEKKRQASRRFESMLDQIQSEYSGTLIEIGKMKMAIFNLFKNVQAIQQRFDKTIPDRASDDISGQLLDIDEVMQDLIYTTNQVKRIMLEHVNTQAFAEKAEYDRSERQSRVNSTVSRKRTAFTDQA